MYEVEQKFKISNPARIRSLLRKMKAKRISSGTESDEFYDFGRHLISKQSILRLRKNAQGKGLLTFKGPRLKAHFKKRIEVQTPVDYASARTILQRAGFKKSAAIRKKREEYKIGGAHVTLDRLTGIGWFVEIEASARQIHQLAAKLGFSAKDREERSYLQMLLSPRLPG